MSIALLYERSETDENGIKHTAEELGIELKFIPFRKIAVSICKDRIQLQAKAKTTRASSKTLPSCLTEPKAKTADSTPPT